MYNHHQCGKHFKKMMAFNFPFYPLNATVVFAENMKQHLTLQSLAASSTFLKPTFKII